MHAPAHDGHGVQPVLDGHVVVPPGDVVDPFHVETGLVGAAELDGQRRSFPMSPNRALTNSAPRSSATVWGGSTASPPGGLIQTLAFGAGPGTDRTRVFTNAQVSLLWVISGCATF